MYAIIPLQIKLQFYIKFEKAIDKPYSIGYNIYRGRNNMNREFVRLPEFEKQCKYIGLNENDVKDIENTLLDNPSVGDIMEGTGGLRKFRITLQDTGKSGGARVIYIDFAVYEKIYLITAYNKSNTENLTKAERNQLKILVKSFEAELRKKG